MAPSSSKRRALTAALIGCLFLQACETTPIAAMSASPVPKDRILSLPTVDGSAAGTARMTVTRDSGLFGSGPSILLTINKKEVAYFRTSETLTLALAPGEYFVSVVPHPAFGASPREYEVQLKPGANSHYRISVTQGGVLFQRTTETQ